ncbi:Uncharacterized protein dnl_34480 [Desulfonema limicola]|uniref:Uncharacterized protein n=1 Tax=Desulfonema limicola TaxID=45656 RepID=A0A975B8Z3_9BACT|nr:hypothetical protein [Desulfonema limicola]QTA81121.1 Uncharacterized protein dnl_34480 [Desulfonema limicola]
MKKYYTGFALILAVLILLPAHVFAAKWWIMGTVKGEKVKESVITLKLIKIGDSDENFAAVTSTNKYGQYAFSNPNQGLKISNYKLVVFVGFDKIMDVNLDNVKPGGRVPPITIHW